MSLSKWAPLVYARTWGVDFRMIAASGDLTPEEIRESERFILGTMVRGVSFDRPMWSTYSEGRLRWAGLTCYADLLAEGDPISRDEKGRRLYLFVGYSARPPFPPLPPRELGLFRGLCRLVRDRWDEKEYRSRHVTPTRADVDLPAFEAVSAPPGWGFNVDPQKVVVSPTDDDDKYWALASTRAGRHALCLGLSTDEAALEGPFRDVTLLSAPPGRDYELRRPAPRPDSARVDHDPSRDRERARREGREPDPRGQSARDRDRNDDGRRGPGDEDRSFGLAYLVQPVVNAWRSVFAPEPTMGRPEAPPRVDSRAGAPGPQRPGSRPPGPPAGFTVSKSDDEPRATRTEDDGPVRSAWPTRKPRPEHPPPDIETAEAPTPGPNPTPTPTRLGRLIDDFRRSAWFEQLFPDGAAIGWPIPVLREGQAYVIVPCSPGPGRSPTASFTFAWKTGEVVEFVRIPPDDPSAEEARGPSAGTAEGPDPDEATGTRRSEFFERDDELLARLASGEGDAGTAWQPEFARRLRDACGPRLLRSYQTLVPWLFDETTDSKTAETPRSP